MRGPDGMRMRLPQLRPDELQARLDVARGTRDRVYSLLEAVLSVGSRELELHVHHTLDGPDKARGYRAW
ncbi:hypothetical protein [Streptomyces sp. NPDC048496]|uniref:hypothetical protein n=1 Tax=Streptomyces sp. NPDC048496 TaxID=3365558 RepID=UPI0037122D44